MKKIINSFLFLLIFLNFSIAKSEKKEETIQGFNGSKISFAYHLPDNYENKLTYPVLINPGAGKASEDNSFFLGDNPSKYGWIVIETHLYNYKNLEKDTEALLDHLIKKFNVQNNRFHIVGYSANSSTTFRAGIKLSKRFASITGIPGHPSASDSELKKLINTKTKVQLIVGENDGYWTRESQNAYKRLKDLGINVTLEVVENTGHVIRQFVGDEFLKRIDKLRES